jgi:hypothetical protein
MPTIKEHTFDMKNVNPKVRFVAMWLDPTNDEVMGEACDTLKEAQEHMRDTLNEGVYVPIRIYEITF